MSIFKQTALPRSTAGLLHVRFHLPTLLTGSSAGHCYLNMMFFWGASSFGRIVPECAIKIVQVSFSGKSSFLHVSTQNTVSVCDTAGDFSTHCSVYHTLHQCCFSELFRSAVTISNWKWILRSEPDSQCQSADSKARIQEHARQGEGDNGLNNPLEGKGSIWRRARAWRMRCLCGSGYWDREFRDHSRTQKGRTTTDAYLETHEEM